MTPTKEETVNIIPPIHMSMVTVEAESVEAAREKAHAEHRGIVTNVRVVQNQDSGRDA